MLKPFYLEECASTLATTYSSGGGGEKKIVSLCVHQTTVPVKGSLIYLLPANQLS